MTRSVVRGSLSDNRDERTGWLLVLGTIPVGILGVVLEHPVRTLFGSPVAASAFLAINGLTMFVGERLRRRAHLADTRPIERLSYGQSLLIGLAQSLALLPGISRSGISMVAGLLCGLDHEDAAEFSFLLATPVILAAALFEIPRLLAPAAHLALVEALLGAIVAGVAAYFSVAFLTRYFKSNDLRPFGWYCVVFGIIALVLSLRGIIT
jgi:undecaprenyl-diphosphatase